MGEKEELVERLDGTRQSVIYFSFFFHMIRPSSRSVASSRSSLFSSVPLQTAVRASQVPTPPRCTTSPKAGRKPQAFFLPRTRNRIANVVAAMASSSSPSSAAVDPDHLPPAISAVALAELLQEGSNKNKNIRVLDGSWFMPNVGRDGRAEFLAGPRIPASAFFDVAGVCDRTSDLPHMLPTAASFATAADALGVLGPEMPVVVYDRAGVFSAPRVWWTFRVFGHRKSVLGFSHFFFVPLLLSYSSSFSFLHIAQREKTSNNNKTASPSSTAVSLPGRRRASRWRRGP